MRGLDHPNVLPLLGVCFAQRPFFIVLPLMSNGDARIYLHTWASQAGVAPPTAQHILQLCLGASRGLAYLAEQTFVHRDIAAR